MPGADAALETALVLPPETAAPAIGEVPFATMEADPVVAIVPEAVIDADEKPTLAAVPAPPDLRVPDQATTATPVALETEAEPEAVEPMPPEQVAAVSDCAVDLRATPAPAGLVQLALSAPCAPLAQVTIHHQGMMFSALTDPEGAVQVTVPALAEQALFIADVRGGGGAVALVDVPEVAGLDRAVLQWQGDIGLDLHAREFGADYGSAGHVWSAAPRDAQLALAAGEGFLLQLGEPAADQPLMAQVYTFPRALAHQDGDVVLTVEAEVGTNNCGQEIAAQSIQIAPGAEPTAIDLTLALPGCDAVGEMLVLSGMLTDLHLAAN